jgi:hypothetical protein
MDDTKDTGGPAFPTSLNPDGPFGGMTLRDYFAGQALPEAVEDYDRKSRRAGDMKENVLPWACKALGTREEIIARQAYRYADAMLRERAE